MITVRQSIGFAAGLAVVVWTGPRSVAADGAVALRSGVVDAGRAAVAAPAVPGQPGRWIVRSRF